MKRIVTIGGGTGSFVVLSGLSTYVHEVAITAICTAYDDGGSTGRLRDEHGALPMGDARRCLLALSPIKSDWRRLFEYRFGKDDGQLADHNLGNLIMMAGERIWRGESIDKIGTLLQAEGQVVPVSYDTARLVATLSDGSQIRGESKIGQRSRHDLRTITKIALEGDPVISEDAARAIREADMIVLCPGSFYTSLMPCLITRGVREAIASSQAQIVWVPNLMNHETRNASVEELAAILLDHIPRAAFNAVITNAAPVPEELLKHYADSDGEMLVASPREYARAAVEGVPYAYKVVSKNVVSQSGFEAQLIRHDSEALAHEIISLCRNPARKIFVIDIDDTLAHTTSDLRGNEHLLDQLTAVGGARIFLEEIRRHGHGIVILSAALSTGHIAYQKKKLEIIGISDLCYDVRVVVGHDAKEHEFQKIMLEFDRQYVVVIGDAPQYELLHGSNYGCAAIVRVELPVRRHFLPDMGRITHRVRDFTDPVLKDLLRGLETV